MTQDTLSESSLHLAGLARQAAACLEVAGNSERVGPDKKSILRMLRRSARRATRLGTSAGTPMSVSVFGPSQAGKSFLVSVLARPDGGRLVVDFGGNHLDYIRARKAKAKAPALSPALPPRAKPCRTAFPST